MGKDALEKIEIKFVGDSKSLTLAIDKLDKATKKLLNTQAKIVDFNKKTNTSNNKNKETLKKLNIQLKLHGMTLKDLNAPLGLFAKAVKKGGFELEAIKLKTRQVISAHKKHKRSLDQVNTTTKKVTHTQRGLVESLLGTSHSTRLLDNSFATLRSRMLLFNFAMGLGIRQLIKFSSEASKVESMSRAFNTLSGGGVQASKALKQLEQATNNTMTQFDLFQQANNAMLLGVTDSSDEMAKMFDMAQRLGNALGRDTASSVESLITGIGRQSRLMLDNIGIIVKSKEAYESLANELDTTVDALTDVQKKQAFMTATIKSAEMMVKLLNPEVQNSQQIFGQLNKATNDLAIALGQALLPILETSAKFLIAFSNTFADVRKLQTFGNGIQAVAVTLGVYITTLKLATVVTSRYTLGIVASIKVKGLYTTATKLATLSTHGFSSAIKANPIGLLVTALGASLFALFEYKSKMDQATESSVESSKKVQDQEVAVKELQNQLKELINSQESVNDITERNIKLRDKQIKQNQTLTKSYISELVALKLQKAELMGASDVDLRRLKERVSGNKNLTKAQKALYTEIIETTQQIEALKQVQKEEAENNEKASQTRQDLIKDRIKATEEELAFAKRGEELRKSLFKNTLNFQLEQLEKEIMEYQKHFKMTEEIIQLFADKEKNIRESANANTLQNLEEQNQARKVVLADNLQYQLQLLEEEYQGYLAMKIKQSDVDEWYEGKKAELVMQNLEKTNGLYSAFEASYSTFINSLTDMDMTGQQRRNQILESGKNAFISFVGEMLKEKIKAIIVENVLKKAQETASVASAVTTGTLIAQAYAPASALSAVATGGASAVAGASALASTVALAQTLALPVAEQGGLVGGRRHSQGGTIIEAEQGEFIMSRKAVESVGLETMNNINQGNSGGSTINLSINGGIVDESYVNNELIPALNKATALGNKINA